jgi:hypothetical protein
VREQEEAEAGEHPDSEQVTDEQRPTAEEDPINTPHDPASKQEHASRLREGRI